MRSKLWINYLQ